MALMPKRKVIQTEITVIAFLKISRLRKRSDLPWAASTLRLTKCNGYKAPATQRSCNNGTDGSHFEPNKVRMNGRAATATPTVIGRLNMANPVKALRLSLIHISEPTRQAEIS